VVADALVPLEEPAYQNTEEMLAEHQEVRQVALRFSPTTLFEEATITILTPTVRTLGPVLVRESARMLPNPLSLSQSLVLVWPHLTSLLALTVIVFAISYIRFMKQEIRAG
jgi:ABC-2 type transport system permease protein